MSQTTTTTSATTGASKTNVTSKKMSPKLVSLEMEYEIVLKMYEEAYKNYSATLKNSVSVIEENPCGTFSSKSTNVSQECYDKVWKDAGCTTKASDVNSDDWFSSQTLDGLKKDADLWATTDDDEHKVECYGSTDGKQATDTSKFGILKGYTFWGKSAVSNDASDSASDCKTTCANNKKCTGATFNSDKKLCWIRTGDGEIVEGLSEDYAIVSTLKQQAFVLKKLNEKLTSLNAEIIAEMGYNFGQINDTANTSAGDDARASDGLLQYAGLFKPSEESIRLNQLSEDKQQIDDAIKQLEGANPINGEFADSFMQAKQSRIFYMILCIVALGLIGIAVQNSVASKIIVLLIIIMIIAIFSVSKS
jgi:hypothetical protein